MMFHEILVMFFTWLTCVVHGRNGPGKDGRKRSVFLGNNFIAPGLTIEIVMLGTVFPRKKHQ